MDDLLRPSCPEVQKILDERRKTGFNDFMAKAIQSFAEMESLTESVESVALGSPAINEVVGSRRRDKLSPEKMELVKKRYAHNLEIVLDEYDKGAKSADLKKKYTVNDL